jgi:hypothetical protein
MTSEQIRQRVARRNGFGFGCDSGMHPNIGRCDCDGGHWDEVRVSGRMTWAFWLPGASDPLYVEYAPWWRRWFR